jgi:hypothetical protein
MMQYLMDFREQTIHQGEVMLGMDNHGAQQTELCRAFMDMMDIQPVWTPANCTDCTSPVDHHVGQTLKLKIGKRYEEAYEQDEDSWHLPKREGGLGSKRKRMLLAGWVEEAWEEFCADNHECIKSAFVTTGFLVAMDGSENEKIRLRANDPEGLYTF